MSVHLTYEAAVEHVKLAEGRAAEIKGLRAEIEAHGGTEPVTDGEGIYEHPQGAPDGRASSALTPDEIEQIILSHYTTLYGNGLRWMQQAALAIAGRITP